MHMLRRTSSSTLTPSEIRPSAYQAVAPTARTAFDPSLVHPQRHSKKWALLPLYLTKLIVKVKNEGTCLKAQKVDRRIVNSRVAWITWQHSDRLDDIVRSRVGRGKSQHAIRDYGIAFTFLTGRHIHLHRTGMPGYIRGVLSSEVPCTRLQSEAISAKKSATCASAPMCRKYIPFRLTAQALAYILLGTADTGRV